MRWRQAISLLLIATLSLPLLMPVATPPVHATPVPAGTKVGSNASKQSNCVTGTYNAPMVNARVALVKPVFTTTPYSSRYSNVSSFYTFFEKYRTTPASGVVTQNLDWLTTGINNAYHYNSGWGVTYPYYQFISSELAKKCGIQSFGVVNDIDVHWGRLFAPNGTRHYDAVVVGKSEYVTSRELLEYERFVSSGGRLILMDSDNFEVRVDLGCGAFPCETFMYGHGWSYFSGKMTHTLLWNAFPAEDTSFTASLLPRYYQVTGLGGGTVNTSTVMGTRLYQTFGKTVLSNYPAHEESRLVNKTGTSVLIKFLWYDVSSYLHKYGRGDVVCFCIEGNRMIMKDPVSQYFLVQAITTWGEKLPKLGDVTVLAEGEPMINTYGASMSWRSHASQQIIAMMVATARNDLGQTIAVGKAVPTLVEPGQAVDLALAWNYPVSSLTNIQFDFFVLDSDGVPVSADYFSTAESMNG